MRNADEAIEKVLAGLGDVEASVGMERRVLDAVEKRVSGRSGLMEGWGVRSMLLRSVAFGALGAGVVAVIAVAAMMPVLHRLRDGLVQSKASLVSREKDFSSVAPVAPSVKIDSRVVFIRTVKKPNVRKSIEVGDHDFESLDKLRAENHPAPEAPLTEQERLLLRIAHKGDPMEVAALNPSLREAQDVEEKLQVLRFFEPPKASK